MSRTATTSPAVTWSPSLTGTLAVGSERELEIATFWNGAMIPEIVVVARTIVSFAAAVGIGLGDAPPRAPLPPPFAAPCCAQPPATRLATSSRVIARPDFT